MPGVRGDAKTFVIGSRDDIDDPPDRVGAVYGGRTVQEYFNGLYRVRGNRIQIDGAGYAAGGRVTDPAASVHEHQRSSGRQVPKIHLQGALTDPLPVGRIAQIAGGIVGPVDGGTVGRQSLEELTDADVARLLEVLECQYLDRVPGVKRILSHARTRDQNFLDRCLIRGFGCFCGWLLSWSTCG